MKSIFLGLILVLAGAGLSRVVAHECDRYAVCKIGETCECTVSADSAFDRYYYVVFYYFLRGNRYQCQLRGSSLISTDVQHSVFPEGIRMRYSRDDLISETLSIDTTDMLQEQGTAVIKYFIPGSDHSAPVIMHCYL